MSAHLFACCLFGSKSLFMRSAGTCGVKLVICFVPVEMQVHMLQHMSMQHKRHMAKAGLWRALRGLFVVDWRLRSCAACRR